MSKSNKSILRILSIALLAALLLSSLPMAGLAESFSAAVKSSSMKVYADAYGSQYLGSLPKKTIVTVLDYASGIAKIRYNGFTGYARVSDMRTVESFAEKAEVTASTRVYQQPTTSSLSVKVSSGTEVNVLAVSGNIAMIEKNGNVGYISAACLRYEGESAPIVSTPAVKDETASSGSSSEVADESTQEAAKDVISQLPGDVADKIPDQVIEDLSKNEATQAELEALKKALEEEYAKQQAEKEQQKQEETAPQQPSEESIADAFNSGKYSNEELTYLFAVKVMGYNPAAASGLLANIKAESGFRPNANGDSGTSYGICQWHAGRKTRLVNWCEQNGMDYTTLAAQLYFLKYELETYYSAVNKYMKGVENNAQGAYDAAYYFCYNFEAPANRASKSAERGRTAKNTYFPKYKDFA